MKNPEVAAVLYDIADILELQGVEFKPQAYRKAARSIEELSEDIEDLAKKGTLQTIPGVGESIGKKLKELIETGKLSYYERLKKQLPKHIFELMQVPGLGPKKIKFLNEKLGIGSVDELEEAAKKGKIKELAGFGEKSEGEILKGIELLKGAKQRMLLGHALPIAQEIEQRLKNLKEVNEVSLAGSLRRRKETIGDIDILVSSKKPSKVMDFFTTMPDVRQVLAKGPTKSSVIVSNNLQVDLRVIDKNFGAALVYFTGSKEHNIVMRDIAIRKGLKINEYGVFTRQGSRLVAGKTEEDVYKSIGMKCMPPEIRENSGEIEAAMKNRLPKLVGYDEIRGDLHIHTSHTDGKNTVQEMVMATKKIGYEYVCISDHSKSDRIANGNTEEELLEEIKEVRSAEKKIGGIRVFAGAEVSILGNGELDFSDELLKKLDIVVASVHSGFKSSKEQMTKRIISALENEHVDILGHPTGRLIYKREPYEVDLNRIFKSAAENDVLLEINSQPDRMDLKDVYVRDAKNLGCKFAIDTDAHSINGLNYMQLGIAVARRGWLGKEDVANTMTLKELKWFLK
ncbi:MAG: DNA polymerase/3'-5' exonuclease PolX [Candidatus Woesearchaeota archaeon]